MEVWSSQGSRLQEGRLSFSLPEDEHPQVLKLGQEFLSSPCSLLTVVGDGSKVTEKYRFERKCLGVNVSLLLRDSVVKCLQEFLLWVGAGWGGREASVCGKQNAERLTNTFEMCMPQAKLPSNWGGKARGEWEPHPQINFICRFRCGKHGQGKIYTASPAKLLV